jgi:ABC-2 type transport system permease protein
VSWLELPLLLALLSLLVAGIALLLSALYVRYRDLDQVWVVIRQALFYGTPILYVAASLPDDLERISLTVNPLAVIFTEARHALIDPSAPSAAEAVGGAGWLLIPLTFVLAVFCLGLWVFRRDSPYLAENL